MKMVLKVKLKQNQKHECVVLFVYVFFMTIVTDEKIIKKDNVKNKCYFYNVKNAPLFHYFYVVVLHKSAPTHS